MKKKNKSNKKYLKYYFVLFLICSLIMGYLFYNDPGLFPSSILFDGFVSLIMNVFCLIISFIVSISLSYFLDDKNKEKRKLIIFIVVYLIIYIIYCINRFL